MESYQSREHGFSGLILQPEAYALQCPEVWVDTPNPGVHQAAGDTPEGQRDSQVTYNTLQIMFDSERNARQEICDALNKIVSAAHNKQADTGIGTIPYNVTMNPRVIIDTLRITYGRPTPDENDALEGTWNQGWQPTEPIENLLL